MSASSPPPTSDPPGGEPARPAEPNTPPNDESDEQPSSESSSKEPSTEAAADGSRTAEKAPGARHPTKPPPVPTKRPGPPKEGATPTPPPSRLPPSAAKGASDFAPKRWPPVTVADIMARKLIALGEADPVIDLEGGMKRFRFRHLPVVGAGNKLVGLISHRDLLRTPGSGAGRADGEEGTDDEAAPKDRVAGELMRRDVLTARPETPLASAARVMVQKKIGCLPVILDDNTLVGIVTETDFILLAIELLERR